MLGHSGNPRFEFLLDLDKGVHAGRRHARKADFRATNAAVMSGLRYAGLALCAILSIPILVAGRYPARGQERAPVAAQATSASCKLRSEFRVVIDVGHTVDVPGAMSARGIPEYAFNLQLAKDVDQALVDAGFDQTVLLVTATAPWRGLVERAARANGMHADLFIAIHHDSVPDNLLQSWEYEGQQQQYNDDYPGYALFISNDNGDRAGSLMFGHLLGKELQARGLHYTPHYTLALMGHRRRELLDAEAGVYRYDQLIVLRETHMPAVLLEAGSIVNRQEELELGTPERRALTSAAIVAAVDEFCATRARPTAVKIAAPPKAAAHNGNTAAHVH
jgi:N-acetylmuramoyl-L-alanine amidase